MHTAFLLLVVVLLLLLVLLALAAPPLRNKQSGTMGILADRRRLELVKVDADILPSKDAVNSVSISSSTTVNGTLNQKRDPWRRLPLESRNPVPSGDRLRGRNPYWPFWELTSDASDDNPKRKRDSSVAEG